MDELADQKWRRRPVLSALARIIAHGLPILAGVGVAVVLSAAMSDVNALARTAVASLAGAVAFVVTGRYSRRLLPMSMLLDLSMQFPDHAPSRFKMALRSGTVKKLNDWASDRYAPGSPNKIGVDDALALVAALNSHDRRTRGHSERVRALSDLMADRLELSEEQAYKLRWAALLHDIGKLDVPEEILNKPGAPSDSEWAVLQAHPDAERFASVLEPWMGEWIHAIDCHHERFDGDGYPHGKAGIEIPLAARIVAVTDSYETMTSARSYKKPMSAAAAREELVRSAGHHFDPVMVRTFLEISVPRLRWAMGPVAALAHIPLLGPLAQLVTNAGASAVVPSAASAQVSAAAAMVLSGGVVASAVEPAPATPPLSLEQADIAALGDLDLTTLTVSGQTIVLPDAEVEPAEGPDRVAVDVTAAPVTVEPTVPAAAAPSTSPSPETTGTSPPTAAPAGPARATDAPATAPADTAPTIAPAAATAPAPADPPAAPAPPPVDPADDEDEWDDAKDAAKDARDAMDDADSDAGKAADDAEDAAEKWAETAEKLADAEDGQDVDNARGKAEDALEKAVKAAEHAADAQAHAADAATHAQTAAAAAVAIADPQLRAEADTFAADAAYFAATAADHAAAAHASAVEAHGYADRAFAMVESFALGRS